MPYAVEIAPSAESSFKRLDRKTQKRLAYRIDALAQNPRPHGVKKLSGTISRYRVRDGNYRIIYDIDDTASSVIILKVAHRSHAY